MPRLTESNLWRTGRVHFAAIGLNHQMLPVFLGLLLAAAAAWFFLSSRLYGEMRRNYPELYQKLGCPKLFMKKSLATNCQVIRFIFKRDYGETLDPAVIRLCQGLRALFCIYMICLGGCLLLLVDTLW